MLPKLAVLFLVGMAIAALFLASPRRGRGKKGGGDRIKAAARCPECGAWVVEGARCPCGGGNKG